KKMQREGIFREMKLRNYYEKPSEKRVREQAEAVRRARKLARKRAQREGLLPGKAAVKPGAKAGGPGGRGGGAARPGGGPRAGRVWTPVLAARAAFLRRIRTAPLNAAVPRPSDRLGGLLQCGKPAIHSLSAASAPLSSRYKSLWPPLGKLTRRFGSLASSNSSRPIATGTVRSLSPCRSSSGMRTWGRYLRVS